MSDPYIKKCAQITTLNMGKRPSGKECMNSISKMIAEIVWEFEALYDNNPGLVPKKLVIEIDELAELFQGIQTSSYEGFLYYGTPKERETFSLMDLPEEQQEGFVMAMEMIREYKKSR